MGVVGSCGSTDNGNSASSLTYPIKINTLSLNVVMDVAWQASGQHLAGNELNSLS